MGSWPWLIKKKKLQRDNHFHLFRCSEWEFKTAISNVNFPSATGTVILTYITETDWACYRCRRSITGTIPLPFWSRSCRFARGTEARNTETTLKLVLILYYSSVVSHNIFFLSPAMPWSMEIASMLWLCKQVFRRNLNYVHVLCRFNLSVQRIFGQIQEY